MEMTEEGVLEPEEMAPSDRAAYYCMVLGSPSNPNVENFGEYGNLVRSTGMRMAVQKWTQFKSYY